MLNQIIWDIRPNIFPGIEMFRWYGLCWAIGVLLGIYFLKQGTKKDEYPIETEILTIYLMIGILVGARLGHVLFYEPVYYWENPEALLPFTISPFKFVGFQGLASHGGVIGTIIALHLYCRKYGQKHLFILDRIVIPSAILGAFIRIGNLINSEIFGLPTDVPWAFVFVKADDLPRHPTQIYEALCYLLIFFSLRFLKNRAYFTAISGRLFGLGLGLVFLLRFLAEFLKEDQVAFEGGMLLNMGQILSVPMILVGAFFAFRKKNAD
ncbi:prolipoprotein diacylglyceryl transferase [Roseivirga sp.]|uniref:prolipoprotein diacylglyceryl transferase n=1 Tax=Roseivirga sp. TaxID=1964215 RepID=UPI003B8BF631